VCSHYVWVIFLIASGLLTGRGAQRAVWDGWEAHRPPLASVITPWLMANVILKGKKSVAAAHSGVS
jgi:hypothetical protein